MNNTFKSTGKIIIKTIFALFLLGVMAVTILNHGKQEPQNPLSHKELPTFETTFKDTYSFEVTSSEQTYTNEDLVSNIQNFIITPEGGTEWKLFGETEQTPYSYKDEDGMEWSGFRPIFSEDLQKLDGQEILIQGYMFPLGQTEEQAMFLLGPFPVSCPYHYHVTPNLIIEVHAKRPIDFSYDAVNLKGKLELVPKDDEYNVFYRLKEAEPL